MEINNLRKLVLETFPTFNKFSLDLVLEKQYFWVVLTHAYLVFHLRLNLSEKSLEEIKKMVAPVSPPSQGEDKGEVVFNLAMRNYGIKSYWYNE
jgi:hypothetical protein